MEMTAVWKERKSKALSLSSHTALESSQKPRASHIPTASATTWNFLFLQARLTSTSTKSVTYMPGTFCYRHARSHRPNKESGLESVCENPWERQRIGCPILRAFGEGWESQRFASRFAIPSLPNGTARMGHPIFCGSGGFSHTLDPALFSLLSPDKHFVQDAP